MKTIKKILRKSKVFSENILGGDKTISMSILQGIYGIGVNDTQYRSKLKKKIEAAFPDLLIFCNSQSEYSRNCTQCK